MLSFSLLCPSFSLGTTELSAANRPLTTAQRSVHSSDPAAAAKCTTCCSSLTAKPSAKGLANELMAALRLPPSQTATSPSPAPPESHVSSLNNQSSLPRPAAGHLVHVALTHGLVGWMRVVSAQSTPGRSGHALTSNEHRAFREGFLPILSAPTANKSHKTMSPFAAIRRYP